MKRKKILRGEGHEGSGDRFFSGGVAEGSTSSSSIRFFLASFSRRVRQKKSAPTAFRTPPPPRIRRKFLMHGLRGPSAAQGVHKEILARRTTTYGYRKYRKIQNSVFFCIFLYSTQAITPGTLGSLAGVSFPPRTPGPPWPLRAPSRSPRTPAGSPP